MKTTVSTALLAAMTLAAAACGLKPDPPPQFPLSAYGGMGDRMAACMAYASESVCLRQTWGGDDFGD